MKRLILVVVLLPLIGILKSQPSIYHPKRLKINPEICEIPTTEHINHHFVPYKGRRDIINVRNTEIEIRYGGPVPSGAMSAMEEVKRIISDLFPTDEKIIIQISYGTLGQNTLAGASIESWYSDFPNAPKFSAPYPVALAEKLARTQLNDPNDPDILISVNQEQDWHYDFNNPGGIGNKFDFVSIILHEVLHGLGFSAITTKTETGLGFIRLFNNNRHTAYTDFLVTGGIKITDINDGTTELGNALSNNNLYFQLESQMDQYKIFAPASFSSGSSISHLDESTYNNTSNSLMTPSFLRGEIEMDPGAATEMLYDLGWSYTYINHNTANNRIEQPVDVDFEVMVSVESDSGLKDSSLFFYYSSDGFNDEIVEIKMESIGDGLFKAVLPAPDEEKTYQYFFTVEDNRGMMFRSPGIDLAAGPVNYVYSFGPDRIPPLISHEAIRAVSDSDINMEIVASVTDGFTGVDTAFLEWKFNGVSQPNMPLILDDENEFRNDQYTGQIFFPRKLLVTDVIEYRLRAVDKGSFPNLGRTPRGESYFEVQVVPSLEATLTYANDFDLPTEDFEGDFSVATPTGFNNPALHSIHPYVNAGDNNTIDYIHKLKVPIIVDNEYPIIEFDEVVIVEPGEPNVPFGQAEFWDYVIVEGKKFGSNSWNKLLNGYDSREKTQWLNAYNSGLNGNSSLFFNRVIDITASGFFAAGDTIEVRFRLFSDPFAVGWGWCIDNLKIQELALDAVDIALDNEIEIYPNPLLSEEMFIKLGDNDHNELEGAIYTIDGKKLDQFYLHNLSNTISMPYDAGTYILRIKSQKGIVTRKIIKL